VKVVIAGGSGSLGRRISADLSARGHQVVVLARRPDASSAVRQVLWDGRTVGDWAAELEGPDTAVINLAGKLVDCRPTPANVAELRRSRVEPTSALVQASRQLEQPVRHWIQASTTAIWSDAGETQCDESTPLPVGLPQMTGVAQPWEAAFAGANTEHGVILRTSIVLDRDSRAAPPRRPDEGGAGWSDR
jgi:NAD dependent epimerase/dehydratase family enzyme